MLKKLVHSSWTESMMAVAPRLDLCHQTYWMRRQQSLNLNFLESQSELLSQLFSKANQSSSVQTHCDTGPWSHIKVINDPCIICTKRIRAIPALWLSCSSLTQTFTTWTHTLSNESNSYIQQAMTQLSWKDSITYRQHVSARKRETILNIITCKKTLVNRNQYSLSNDFFETLSIQNHNAKMCNIVFYSINSAFAENAMRALL